MIRFSFLTILLSALFASGQEPSPKPKAPPPQPKEVAEGRKAMLDVLGPEIAKAKTPDAKKAMAARLVGSAGSQEEAPGVRWATLHQARDLAASAGDVTTALKAVDAITTTFDTNRPDLLAETAEKLGHVVPMGDPLPLLKFVQQSGAEAVAADQYKAATRLLAVGMKVAALSPKTAPVGWRFEADLKRVNELGRAYDEAKDVPFELGKFLCFRKGNWAEGLKLFLGAKDERYDANAKRDLATPTEPALQLAVADGWFDLAESLSAAEQAGAYRRAFHWYRLAIPGLAGLPKGKAEGRAAKATTVVEAADVKVSGFSLYVGNWACKYMPGGESWEYTILASGEITMSNAGTREGTKGFAIRRNGAVLFVWEDGKILERVKLTGDKMAFERFWAPEYPKKTHAIGTAEFKP